ncbi:MAG: hypothetical protein IJS03_05090 [Eubacterium sp.]|nr:hypothetical protein [Eubacterium sp.]
MDSIEEIRKQLGEFSGLDEEIIQLGKINFNIQDAEYNLKSMIKVLNFAQIKYATCEKEVQNSANVSYTAQSNKARLKKVEFKIPYSSVINWKKGK